MEFANCTEVFKNNWKKLVYKSTFPLKDGVSNIGLYILYNIWLCSSVFDKRYRAFFFIYFITFIETHLLCKWLGGMSMHLQYKFKKEVQFKIHENVLKELDTIEKDIREVAASKGISVSDTIDYLRNKKK